MLKSLPNRLKATALTAFLGLFLSLQLHAQGTLVTGVVRSDTNEPIPGVNVLEKGTTNGTVADSDGKYTINVSPGAVLVFSFIGMKAIEEVVGERSVIDVTMISDVAQLSEVVVIGYGTQKKTDLTGAVSSVAMADLKNVPVTRADQMLQGRVSGVQITQTNAEPGGNISIRIRGTNSINTSNQPLFVVDGFPGAGDLNSINPGDIESIDVLKDASATAIYGSRGANGVVIITTKKGKLDQNNITFEAYTGVQSVRKKYDLMNAQQFGAYLNDVTTLTNQETGSTTALPFPTQASLDALGTGTNWQNEIFRDAPIRNYQLGFSGGSNGTRYNLSFNYFEQEGIIINSGLKRGSVRFNFDRKVSDKINLTFTSQLTRSNESKALVNTAGGSAGGVVMDAMRISPTIPVYDATGAYTVRNGPAPYVETSQVGNPVQYANSVTDNRNYLRGLVNMAVDYEIVKGLKFRTSGGVDMFYGINDSYVPSGIFFNSAVTVGSAARQTNSNFSWINENVLTFDKTFNDKHSLNVVGGNSIQSFSYENYRASASSYFTDVLGVNNLGIGGVVNAPTSDRTVNTLASFFGRVNYKFTERYLLTATMRADGSSKFGPNKKWGYFPSAAAAWRVAEEEFMSNITKVSDLKLRVGYGIVGNQEIDPYQSGVRYQNSNYASGISRLVGQSISQIPNADLHWESTSTFNIGLDLGLFDNRVFITADYYDKTTSDLLLQAFLPATAGISFIRLNAGKVSNRGFEFLINTVNVQTNKFNWTSSLNFTTNQNKVLDLNGEAQRLVGASSGSLFPGGGGQTSILRVGEPIGSFYGYVFDGIWQTQEEINASGITSPKYLPGDPKYVDQDGNGIINGDDRKIIGRAQPDFYYGFTNTLTYGRLSFSFLLQGVQGQDVLNLNRYELESGTVNTNKMTSMLNRWTGPGTSNTIPKANSTVRRTTGVTTEVLEDGSFLRLKTITLGYDLPIPKGISGTVKGASIYVTGTNLITWTNYSGFDPEVNSFGNDNLSLNTDYNAYPASKTIIAGIRVNF